MPLDKYKQKRNFQKTPEPAGSSCGDPKIRRKEN